MAGGGNRKGSGAEELRIGSGNVFAALETLKKKKKKPAAAEKKQAPVVEKPEVFWAPAPLTAKSWADVEDDDDDDYFAATAPLCPVREAQGDDADAGHEDDKEHSALEQVHLASPTARLCPLLYILICMFSCLHMCCFWTTTIELHLTIARLSSCAGLFVFCMHGMM